MKNSNDTIGNRTRDLPSKEKQPIQKCIKLRKILHKQYKLVYNEKSTHIFFIRGGGGEGGGEPKATNYLYLILKILLQKSCSKYNCNMTLLVAAFIQGVPGGMDKTSGECFLR